MDKKTGSSILILMVLSVLTIFILTSCCFFPNVITSSKTSGNSSSTLETADSSNGGTDSSQSSGDDENAAESSATDSENNGNQSIPSDSNRIIYFEVTSSEESNHFEHRVANIYSAKIDGSDKEIVYTDIDDKNDLGQVFNISPDGEKIACMINDGARGVYSALCVIDINSGELKNLVEFDFSEEPYEVTLALYGRPVWSSDSRYLAYELISNPYTSNLRDRGVFTADIETGEIKETVLDAGGASIRSTMFMVPVFFFDYDDKLAAAFHPYRIVEENNEVIDFYSINEGLNTFNVEGGQINSLFDISSFKEEGPEIITSMDNFKYFQDMDKTVFHLLGDFEEDGDIWMSGVYAADVQRITHDEQLREQQPDIFSGDNGISLVAYAGVKRYGTVSNQIPSGDIYVINADGTENRKLTDYDVGPSKPMFSPDGLYIAYLNSIYDENFEYIISSQIEAVRIEDSKITVAAKNGYIELIGWS
ncbi:MAG: TolB family protein, partial [Candidatus Humimicrobiaceae bacterium]